MDTSDSHWRDWGFIPFPKACQGQPNLMESDWRDRANHPEAVAAIWPRVVASGMPPAACLALLATCQHTRDSMLHDAPRAKLTVQLKPEQPTLTSMLRLLKQSGRTQPTTLALLNSSTGQPLVASNPAAQPPLAPHAASTYAQQVLSHPLLLGYSIITRLDLQGVVVDPPLLQAMQGLPDLTHLHLSNIHLTASTSVYQSANLPQGVATLYIDLHRAPHAPSPAFASFLKEFLVLDTITDLTVNDRVLTFNVLGEQSGQQARALRRLSLPQRRLTTHAVAILQRATPLLEELQVSDVDFVTGADEAGGQVEVSWRTLRVHHLDLSECRHLPLGGTQPLDIHISGSVRLGVRADRALATITHLTSQQTRPVHLMGSGVDVGAFSCEADHEDLIICLSVLQLSKAPVRRLAISLHEIEAEHLLVALQPLTALTHLSLSPAIRWDAADLTGLLTHLPLHVEHVRLASNWNRLQPGFRSMFSSMAKAVGRVRACRHHPLHLCVVGERPGSEVWEAVARYYRARGKGVVMVEAWD